MALSDLPQSKWGTGTGRQVLLKSDFSKLEAALLEAFELVSCPELTWVDATQVKVAATADCKARLLMCGFPSPLHRGLFVDGGLSDGKYRENGSDAALDFDTPSTFWGHEKTSQWYGVYGIAANADTTFALKGMPVMRFSSQAAQVITLRNNANAADIGYGLITNELANARLLVLTGASKGLTRTITANNNDNTTLGTITYSGTALTMAPGDWFMVLPNINFRYLGMIFNNASGDIQQFVQKGRSFRWANPVVFASGALNGFQVQSLDFAAPLTARLVKAVAYADYGWALKMALSYDGLNTSDRVHIAYPGSGFKSAGAGAPFSFIPLPNHTIYLDNENTGSQFYAITGWEE